MHPNYDSWKTAHSEPVEEYTCHRCGECVGPAEAFFCGTRQEWFCSYCITLPIQTVGAEESSSPTVNFKGAA